MSATDNVRELWLLGLGDRKERGSLTCSYLAEAGYRARTANITELATGRPLGILLDLSPFSQDGWGALRELKANPATKNIPILAATALFRDSDLKTCMDFGCNGYIVKPFTFQELQGKVKELIPAADVTFPR